MNTLKMTTSPFPIAGTTLTVPHEMEKFVKQINRELIGAERHFNRYFSDSPLNSSNYPPYNLEKFGDDHYRITVAIAGFSKENIDITVENDLLTIDGKSPMSSTTVPQTVAEHDIMVDTDFLYRGIANRDFKLRFTLADYVEVKEARFENGLLCLELLREVPESMKPKTIEIK